MPKPPSTVYLGQFSDARANAITAELDKAGIGWWAKQAGPITRFFFIGDWGVRLYSEKSQLEEAKRIAARVLEPRPDPGEDPAAGG